jgi:hypothetical protein
LLLIVLFLLSKTYPSLLLLLLFLSFLFLFLTWSCNYCIIFHAHVTKQDYYVEPVKSFFVLSLMLVLWGQQFGIKFGTQWMVMIYVNYLQFVSSYSNNNVLMVLHFNNRYLFFLSSFCFDGLLRKPRFLKK